MKTAACWVGILLLAIPGIASTGGVFKCLDQNGNVVYQGSPCKTGHTEMEITVRPGGVPDEDDETSRQESVAKLNQRADRLSCERRIRDVDRRIESLQKRIWAIQEQRQRGGPQELVAELRQLQRDQMRGEWRPTVPRFARHGVGDAIIQVEDQIAKRVREDRNKEAGYQDSIEELKKERKRLEEQLAKLE